MLRCCGSRSARRAAEMTGPVVALSAKPVIEGRMGARARLGPSAIAIATREKRRPGV